MSGSVGRGRSKKTWEVVIKMDFRERKVSKDLSRGRLASVGSQFSENRPTHASM